MCAEVHIMEVEVDAWVTLLHRRRVSVSRMKPEVNIELIYMRYVTYSDFLLTYFVPNHDHTRCTISFVLVKLKMQAYFALMFTHVKM